MEQDNRQTPFDRGIEKVWTKATEHLEDHYYVKTYGWSAEQLQQHREKHQEKPRERIRLLHQYLSNYRRYMQLKSPGKTLQAWAVDENDPAQESPYSSNMLITSSQLRSFIDQSGNSLLVFLKETLENHHQLHRLIVDQQQQKQPFTPAEQDRVKRCLRGSHTLGPLPEYVSLLMKKPAFKRLIQLKTAQQCNIKKRLGVMAVMCNAAAIRKMSPEQKEEKIAQLKGGLPAIRGEITAALTGEQKVTTIFEQTIQTWVEKDPPYLIEEEINNIFEPVFPPGQIITYPPGYIKDVKTALQHLGQLLYSSSNDDIGTGQAILQTQGVLQKILQPSYGEVIGNLNNICNEMATQYVDSLELHIEDDAANIRSRIKRWINKIRDVDTNQSVQISPWKRIQRAESLENRISIVKLFSFAKYIDSIPVINTKLDTLNAVAVECITEQLPSEEEEKEERQNVENEKKAQEEIGDQEPPEIQEREGWETGSENSEYYNDFCSRTRDNPLLITTQTTLLGVPENPCEKIAGEFEGNITEETKAAVEEGEATAAEETAAEEIADAAVVAAEREAEELTAGAFSSYLGISALGGPGGIAMMAAVMVAPKIIDLLHSLLGSLFSKHDDNPPQSSTVLMINAVSPTIRKEWQGDGERKKGGVALLTHPKDLFVQGWQSNYINDPDHQKKSDLYMEKGMIHEFTASKPLVVADHPENWCALTASLQASKQVFEVKGKIQYREPQLYTCSFLHTNDSEEGIGGMALFSIPKNGCHVQRCADQPPAPELERKLAFSFHGKDGVSVQVLSDDGQDSREDIYASLTANRKTGECTAKKDKYALYAKVANPQHNHTFSVVTMMHEDSTIFKQWSKDQSFNGLFPV